MRFWRPFLLGVSITTIAAVVGCDGDTEDPSPTGGGGTTSSGGGGGTGGVGMGGAAGAGGVGGGSPIQPSGDNPWYWEMNGSLVLLVGGSDQDNLFQIDDLETHLEDIAAAGGNYVRNTMSSRDDGDMHPFAEVSAGTYDLDQWNDAYWTRFDDFLSWTAERSIVVQIEVWDRFDYSRDPWETSPYNPINNVNYTQGESGLAADYPNHPGQNEQPFFKTVPDLEDNQVVRQHQEAVVDKMLSYSLTYGHVLYTMDNETSGDPAWGAYWSTWIKQGAQAANVVVHTTEMWDNHDVTSTVHYNTYDHPELYSFADISQNTHQVGELHWDRVLEVRQILDPAPWPINNVKIYGADGASYGDTADAIERFWRNLLGGLASSRFHRPPAGIGLSNDAGPHLQAVRLVEERARFWDLAPHNELLGQRDTDEAYLAAKPGELYVLYFTDGGSVTIDLSGSPATFRLAWVDFAQSAWSNESQVTGDQTVTVDTLGSGPQVVVLDVAQ